MQCVIIFILLGITNFKTMRTIIQKIKQSTEWEIIGEMTKPRIILGALLFNICAFVFMYGFLDLLLYIHYDL